MSAQNNGNASSLESVIVIEQDGKPAFMARKEQGGAIKHYALKEANWADHQTMHHASIPHMTNNTKDQQ